MKPACGVDASPLLAGAAAAQQTQRTQGDAEHKGGWRLWHRFGPMQAGRRAMRLVGRRTCGGGAALHNRPAPRGGRAWIGQRHERGAALARRRRASARAVASRSVTPGGVASCGAASCGVAPGGAGGKPAERQRGEPPGASPKAAIKPARLARHGPVIRRRVELDDGTSIPADRRRPPRTAGDHQDKTKKQKPKRGAHRSNPSPWIVPG